MIDTHTHIYLEEFDEDRVEVVRRAREAGVERVILPNVDFDTPCMPRTICFPVIAVWLWGYTPRRWRPIIGSGLNR